MNSSAMVGKYTARCNVDYQERVYMPQPEFDERARAFLSEITGVEVGPDIFCCPWVPS